LHQSNKGYFSKFQAKRTCELLDLLKGNAHANL